MVKLCACAILSVILAVEALLKNELDSERIVFLEWAIEDDGCRTPDRAVGTCILIDNCKPIMDVLDAVQQPLPPKVANMLKSYHCGFQGRRPKVCCPPKPIYVPGIVSEKNPANVVPEPPNVSGHRNLNLLPTNCGHLDTTDRIVYGNKTELFEFPWMALLSYRTQRGPDFKCGGTIINERYILTAAHCVTDLRYALLGVRVGEHDISTRVDCQTTQEGERICAPPYQDLAVEEIIPHPDYDKKAHTNDIGLLRVTRIKLNNENMRPICLPLEKARNYNYTDRNAVVTGWGATESGRTSTDLLKAEIPMVSLEDCKRKYNNIATINHRQLCAGGATRSDSCSGDSGGPLHVLAFLHNDQRYVQQGIVSFGPKICGQTGLPGIYTKVAYFMPWILDNMKP